MQIDTEHLHHWMQAIRQSPDPIRTMDAFWSGQLRSKEWLITNLRNHIKKVVTIDIHGGWNGLLASLLFQSDIPVLNIRSIDIDPLCEPIAVNMNKLEEMVGRFRAVTADMCDIRSDADVVINTSCEHITQDDYDLWLSGMPHNSLLVLQSNNYNIPEHIRIANSLDEFKAQCQIEVLWAGELKLPLYTRYMIIGRYSTNLLFNQTQKFTDIKDSPNSVVEKWVSRISKKNSNLGGHRICPFAKMPRVVSVEKLSIEVFSDFSDQITVYMENGVYSSYKEIEDLCNVLKDLNPNFVFLPDHPHKQNYISNHETGNGVFPCIIVQTKQELETARTSLEKTDYYQYWDKDYLAEIKSFD